ncbi:CCA tRNA nucleotidyltransferase [Blastochloris sulfoviridis]|uniref:CCA tRNA nucleotidyltransferase n=1 Tax=Blastochloris sulfoviridis TaxID=50712 RepID=A0A5M6I1W6_9HYPH|nr:CCA tRNA nucleotidyltransferase [Blastochloris sulfoviridis]KAA5602200.1 CCA tRNA nucleotidyltransferase [Blastochloris sulfoviridis]
MTPSSALVPSLAGAAWLFDGPAARVLAMLDRDGEEARVVGGAVRNALMGQPPGDIDIATTATPDEVTRRAHAAGLKPVPTGLDHGTVTVVADGVGIEVTTLRQDVETDGRRAMVAFGRDWEADARRRDFTINAFSADRTGHVYDPIGGFDDLARRRVRFIGDPVTRIREDYLRILRFFRFHAGYGVGAPDAAGLTACLAERAGLAKLSRERIRLELLKLFKAAGAGATLEVMADTGLIHAVLGGIADAAAFSRLAAIESARGLAPDPVRRLAVLAVRIEEDAARLHDRLRLANDETRRLTRIAAHWRHAAAMTVVEARTLLYRLGAPDYRDVVLAALALSGEAAAAPGWADRLDLPQRWTPPPCPIKAADLMARGLKPGPALGRALAQAEAAWIAAGFPLAPDAIGRIVGAAAGLGSPE